MAENDALPKRIYIDTDYDANEFQGHGGFFTQKPATGQVVSYVRERADLAAPDAPAIKDAIKAIAAPKAETIAKGIRELGLASFGTEGASKAQFFIETQLLDFIRAVDCLRLLHTDVSPDAVRQARRGETLADTDDYKSKQAARLIASLLKQKGVKFDSDLVDEMQRIVAAALRAEKENDAAK